MRRKLVLGGVVGCLTLLTITESAQAQIFFGRNRGGTYFELDTPIASVEAGPSAPYRSYYYYDGYYGPYYSRWYSVGPYYRWYSWYPSRPFRSSFWYGPEYYSGPITNESSSTSAQSPGSRGYQSFYAGPSLDRDKILLRINVPIPDAKVWIENQPTQQMGLNRLFISPPLDPQKEYTYSVRASWMQNGQEVTQEKTLSARTGQEVTANFSVVGEQKQNKPGRPAEKLPKPDAGRFNNSDGRARDVPQDPEPGRVNAPVRATSSLVEGKAILIESDQIIVENKDKKQSILKIKPDTQFMMDGKNADRLALKPGMQVSATMKTDEPNVAVKIDAKSGDSKSSKNPGGEP